MTELAGLEAGTISKFQHGDWEYLQSYETERLQAIVAAKQEHGTSAAAEQIAARLVLEQRRGSKH